MHTACQLDRSLFKIRAGDEDSDLEAVFPDWRPHDRLGVVVTEPHGSIGASHLIQLAITAFYDVVPSRRDGASEDRLAGPEADNRLAAYPEIYLFHVGGRHGDHGTFDFWPGRKEVFLDDGDPRAVLDAINDRAITRLAVPERAPQPIVHQFKEPNAARERIVSCLAYSPSGRVGSPDFEIEGIDPRTEENATFALDPNLRSGLAGSDPHLDSSDEGLRERCFGRRTLDRLDEAADGLQLARERRRAISRNGLATESYALLEVDDALQMLYQPTAAPAGSSVAAAA